MQHLLVAQDSSMIVHPPNLKVDHPEWQHVFLQTTDGERQLTQDTKYLFCKYKGRSITSYMIIIHAA